MRVGGYAGEEAGNASRKGGETGADACKAGVDACKAGAKSAGAGGLAAHGDDAALPLVEKWAAVEARLVGGVGSAGLSNEKRFEPCVLDALSHEGHVLELAALLSNERYANLCRRQALCKQALEVVGFGCDGLCIVCDHLGALNLFAVLNYE